MSGIWGFVKRHKRKFIITSAVLGGGALVARYAANKFEEWEKRHLKQLLAKEKKQQYFANIYQSCLTTCRNLTPKIKRAIDKLLDVDGITLTLKNNPPNKVELWEYLTLLTFTKNITFLVSSVLLAVLIHVQLGIIGGYLYRAQVEDDSASVIDSSVQEQYLLACDHFINQGLEELVAYIQPIVKSVIQNIPLTKSVSTFDLQVFLNDIERVIVSDFKQAPKIYIRSMIASEVNSMNNNGSFDGSWNDAILNRMNTETSELLETNEASIIISEILHMSWDFLLDACEENFSS